MGRISSDHVPTNAKKLKCHCGHSSILPAYLLTLARSLESSAAIGLDVLQPLLQFPVCQLPLLNLATFVRLAVRALSFGPLCGCFRQFLFDHVSMCCAALAFKSVGRGAARSVGVLMCGAARFFTLVGCGGAGYP